MDPDEMKIRVIGDYNVGRRSLIIAVDRKFELDPDVFINPGLVDSFLIKMKWDGTPYSVYIDMNPCAGEPEDIEMIRRMCYFMQDVFLVCFSTVIPESLENVSKKWIPKIRDYCIHNRGLPFPIILLVGTQIDLRQDRATLDKLADKNQIPISSKVWVKVAKQIGAAKYVECSAMTKEGLHGVDSIIDQACYERLKQEEKKKKMCTII